MRTQISTTPQRNCFPEYGRGWVGAGIPVEALGGHMRIASPSGDGTVLHVTIPTVG